MRDGLDIRALWEVDLIQGGVAEEAATSDNLAETISGSTIRAILDDGSEVEDAGGGMGDVVRGQQFKNPPDAALEADIRRELRDLGLDPVSVEILHPLSSAPAVVARTSDATNTAKEYHEIVSKLFGSPPQYEGYYVELQDASGAAFIRASADFRTGAGRLWVQPQYRGVASVAHG